MSQTRESISPPPPRRQASAVTNLVRANRQTGTEVPPPVQPPETATDPAKKQVTIYMKKVDRERAKAAYQATSSQENDRSWSDFVALALMNEVERREAKYNNGEPFPGGTENLTRGRKLAP